MSEINWQENYKSFAEFLLYEGEKIQSEMIDRGRWTIISDNIYKYQDKYYKFTSKVGATEQQEGMDNEYSEPYEVKPVKKMIETTVYEKV